MWYKLSATPAVLSLHETASRRSETAAVLLVMIPGIATTCGEYADEWPRLSAYTYNSLTEIIEVALA